MAKPNPRVLLKAATGYLKAHPEEILRAVRGALGLRVGVPIDALRYMAEQFVQGDKAPQDVVIEAAPPGMALAATVQAMGATLRASLTAFVDEIDICAEHARITVRIADMHLEVLDGVDTPVGGLVASGALDLSKPGNLVAYMPKRPPQLVEAEDDRIVVDLLRVPKLSENPKARRWLAMLSPVVSIQAVRTRDDHLDVHLGLRPQGVHSAYAEARRRP